MGRGVAVAHRTLTPAVKVQLLPPQPKYAGMMELADIRDLKSLALMSVRVRPPLSAPNRTLRTSQRCVPCSRVGVKYKLCVYGLAEVSALIYTRYSDRKERLF